MSFFGKLFGKRTTCPLCESTHAKETLSGIECVTPGCENNPKNRSKSGREVSFSQPVEVVYENHRGEAKHFTADAGTVRLKGAHVTMQVAPRGVRIALKLEKIRNFQVIEPFVRPVLEALKKGATPHELYVLHYHRKRGTTSPLNEALRAKYASLLG